MNDTCQHDPMFTTDGRCSKCYPRKRIIAVQHINGTVEIDDVRLGYIDKAHMIIDEAQAVADAKMAEYAKWQENSKDWHDIKGDLDI